MCLTILKLASMVQLTGNTIQQAVSVTSIRSINRIVRVGLICARVLSLGARMSLYRIGHELSRFAVRNKRIRKIGSVA